MNYPSNIEQKLAFDRIREWAAAYCATDAGRQKMAEATFSASFDETLWRLSLTDELRTCLLMENAFPHEGYVDATPFLKKLRIEGLYLEAAELLTLKQALETVHDIVRFFGKTKEGKYSSLKKLLAPVVVYPAVLQRMDAIINKHGAIKDNASPELLSVRRAMADKQGQVTRRMQTILKTAQAEGLADENASVSIRDGRAVIPVPAGYKRKIKGLVYDESASGKTVFLEPLEVVELNNELKELGYAEQREITAILRAFVIFLHPYLDDVMAAADLLGEMDFIRAKAQWAIQTNAVKPIVYDEPHTCLWKARHPLLEQTLRKEGKVIVPLDLQLTPEKHILLISGPNAGGKSVCLKTVGLLQYMLQCGFPVTASENSEMGLFRELFIDIGDEQSIDNDLSTYSSRLLNMKYFVQHAGASTLLLIDEFGSGTEPTAGGAIAEAVLDRLVKQQVFGVITTHYTNLKYYATSSDGILNGAMQFDVQQIQPLFRLETGAPSSSFAFELAHKMGLPEDIVKEAEAKAGTQYVNIEKNLRNIARDKRYWEEKRQRIRQTDKYLEDVTSRYQSELSELQKIRKQIIQEAKNEAKQLLVEANKRIEHTILEIREAQAEKERTKAARQQVEELKQHLQSNTQADADAHIARKMEQLRQRQERRAQHKRDKTVGRVETASVVEQPLQSGDKVRLQGQDVIGEITRISATTATVGYGSVFMNVPLVSLERISGNEFRKIQKAWTVMPSASAYHLSQRKLHFKTTLDVRGQRADEALDNVMQLIDEAFMVGVDEVKILHGKGNGILKEEIRKWLKTVGGITSIADEQIEFGGSGITVVRFT
ncbi:MAG: Smr/MutS family protein [Prevotellaceae bacterium]|jgi:DNA mismatch repair protein MutS2|nr:Smr/MutS family protein [Prevotellaceae bacterium]